MLEMNFHSSALPEVMQKVSLRKKFIQRVPYSLLWLNVQKIFILAKGIRRPLFAIYRRVLRMYDRRNYIGKYSSEEVEQLKSLKEKHGNDWATIGAAMGRSASSVKDRFRLMREHCHSGKNSWLVFV